LKKASETWFGYILWVAFLIASIAFILNFAIPYLKALKTKKEVETAINLLKKMKRDAQFLAFTGYGSEFSYDINFDNAYIVVYKNESIVQIRFLTKEFPFKASDFKDSDVKAYFDFDQLVLETELPKKFLRTFSSKAKGTFYLRNKVVGFILTNKKGVKLNLNFSYEPTENYLSWNYTFNFNYSNPWEDIWLKFMDNNNNFKPFTLYFFENLTNVTVDFNFKDNQSFLADLYLNLFTDFGNYWSKNLNLEVPYNSKVNVSFVFDNVNNASINLTFNYLGRNWSIDLSGSCSDNFTVSQSCLDKPLDYVCYNISKTQGSSCTITFNFYNLPTYTNYSIAWSYNSYNGNTWRVFTPYIRACNDTGSGLSCDSKYWSTSGTVIYSNSNNFYLNSLYINTKCVSYLRQCGVNYYNIKCFHWENNIIKINGKNLLNSYNDC